MRRWSWSVVALVVAAGCESDVVVEDGGGGGENAGTSTGSVSLTTSAGGSLGTGGAPEGGAPAGGGGSGGEVPLGPACTGLVQVGGAEVVGEFGHVSRFPMSRVGGAVVIAQERIPGQSVSWFDAWSTWPPLLIDERTDLSSRRVVSPIQGSGNAVTTLIEHWNPTPDPFAVLDLTPDDDGLPIGLDGVKSAGIARSGDAYLAMTLSDLEDSEVYLKWVSFAGDVLSQRTLHHCAGATRKMDSAAILGTDAGSQTWLALDDARPPARCTDLTQDVVLYALDEEGEGAPTTLEDSDDGILSTLALVPRPEIGPLLVYSRYFPQGPTSDDRVTIYTVPLDMEGLPTAPAHLVALEATPTARIGVVPVSGGFVLVTNSGEGFGNRLYVSLVDFEGNVVQQLMTDIDDSAKEGPRGVAAPDGRSVVVATTDRGEALAAYDSRISLLRFDCVVR